MLVAQKIYTTNTANGNSRSLLLVYGEKGNVKGVVQAYTGDLWTMIRAYCIAHNVPESEIINIGSIQVVPKEYREYKDMGLYGTGLIRELDGSIEKRDRK